MRKNKKDWNALLQKKIYKYDPDLGSAIVNKIKRLIKKGADPNFPIDEKGKTLLMDSAEGYLTNITEALIKYGATIDQTDNEGANALMYAAKWCRIENIKLLLEKGADVNATDHVGNTALIYAIKREENITVFEELIKAGTNINLKNKEDNSALHFAVTLGRLKTVGLLFENGSDIRAEKENILHSLNDYYNNVEEIKDLLLKHGADNPPFFIQYNSNTFCDECGKTLPLNGPVQKAKCDQCNSYTELNTGFWTYFFRNPPFVIDSPGLMNIDAKPENLICSNNLCNSELNTDKYNFGTNKPLICPTCGEKNISYPAPKWLQEFQVLNKKPRQIFSNAMSDDSIKPIGIKCVSCNASLTISHETPRMCTCEHCKTDQYLPDGIWKKLHPVNKKTFWYIYFS